MLNGMPFKVDKKEYNLTQLSARTEAPYPAHADYHASRVQPPTHRTGP